MTLGTCMKLRKLRGKIAPVVNILEKKNSVINDSPFSSISVDLNFPFVQFCIEFCDNAIWPIEDYFSLFKFSKNCFIYLLNFAAEFSVIHFLRCPCVLSIRFTWLVLQGDSKLACSTNQIYQINYEQNQKHGSIDLLLTLIRGNMERRSNLTKKLNNFEKTRIN